MSSCGGCQCLSCSFGAARTSPPSTSYPPPAWWQSAGWGVSSPSAPFPCFGPRWTSSLGRCRAARPSRHSLCRVRLLFGRTRCLAKRPLRWSGLSPRAPSGTLWTAPDCWMWASFQRGPPVAFPSLSFQVGPVLAAGSGHLPGLVGLAVSPLPSSGSGVRGVGATGCFGASGLRRRGLLFAPMVGERGPGAGLLSDCALAPPSWQPGGHWPCPLRSGFSSALRELSFYLHLLLRPRLPVGVGRCPRWVHGDDAPPMQVRLVGFRLFLAARPGCLVALTVVL